jgi:hypothetical protein
MYAQAESLFPQLTDSSLTDVILALCASGHFGVREAIAAATRQEPRRLGSDPADACRLVTSGGSATGVGLSVGAVRGRNV